MKTKRYPLPHILLAVVVAFCLCCSICGGVAFADMSTMGSANSSSDAASSAQSASTTDEAAEQLGLMVHLSKLTGSSQKATDGVSLDNEGVGALFPTMLSLTTTPSVISTGIECKMDEVCGFDPCTCGKPDAWGHCACGGFKDTVPDVSVTVADTSVAKTATFLGKTWIVPVSAGTTTVTIKASLVHYKDAVYSFQLTVNPLGIADVLLVVAALLLAAALLTALFFAVRFLARRIHRGASARKAVRAQGRKLKEEHPLTWKARLDQATGKKRKARRPRNPFVHDFLYGCRQGLPVLLGALVVFCVLVPVSTSVISDVSVFNVDYTHEQIKYQLYAQSAAPFVNGACVLYGFLLAFALFKFLLEKKAVTAFFSVGLSRQRLFASRYLVGALFILLGIAIPFCISLALNVAALGLYDGQIPQFFYVVCGYLLVALIAFTISAFSVSRAGTLFESCSFAAALLLGITVILWGVGCIAENLLVGNASGISFYGQDAVIEPSLLDGLSFVNPVLFFAEEGASHQYFMAMHPVYYPQDGSWLLLAAWLGVCVVLGGVALLSFCRRSGEQAEMAGKSPVLSLITVAVFGLAVFAVALRLLENVDLGVALVSGFILFVLVSVVLLFGPYRGRTSAKVSLLCTGSEFAALAVVVLIIYTGAFGFSSYVPELATIDSVEVSYVGSPSYLTSSFAGMSGGSSYYFTSSRTYSDADSVETVRQVHQQLIGSARDQLATNYTDFGSTTVIYDVKLVYTLADGSTLTRYYDRASVQELSQLTALDDDAQSKALEAAVVSGSTGALSDEDYAAIQKSPAYKAYRSGAMYVADGALNKIMALDCSDQDRLALLEALSKDLATLSSSERYAPQSQAKAVLMFTLSPETDVDSFGYSFSNAVSYITDEWVNTMAWMNEHGVFDSISQEIDTRIIESLSFQLDDPYASINKVTMPTSRYFMGYRTSVANQYWVTQDYGALKTVTDQAQIAEVMPNLRLGCYMTGGYLVQAKLRGIEAYVYFYLPAQDAPSYL